MSGGGWLLLVILVVLLTVFGRRKAKKLESVAPSSKAHHKAAEIALSNAKTSEGNPVRNNKRRLGSVPPQWLPRDSAAEVAGRLIPGGMIYVGSPSSDNARHHALIDPALPVATKNPDGVSPPLGYWPRYDTISPEARSTYLQWIINGRNDPHIDIGYVFLYFYGLERRLFFDRAESEFASLVAEVRRLRETHGGNSSFASYSSRFLEAAMILAAPPKLEDPPHPRLDDVHVMSFNLRLALGKRLLDGTPLMADWLLAWVLADEQTWLSTAVRRLFDETCRLFRIRFAQRFPEGLVVKPPKGKIGSFSYRAASSDFTAEIAGPFADWPNISRLTKPVEIGREILLQCAAELDGAGRFLGKNPDARDTLRTNLLLPAELIGTGAVKSLDELRQWLGERELKPSVVDDLLEHLDLTSGDGKINKTLARTVAEMLEKLGFGIEPDVRFGGRLCKPGEPVILFRHPEAIPRAGALGQPYQSAAMLLALYALIIHADDQATSDKGRRLQALVKANAHLSVSERARLTAHAHWLLSVPPSFQQVRKRLAPLPDTKKADIGRFVIAMATGDGALPPQRIRLLERLYKALGLETSQLFSDLHALEADTDTPVVVRPAANNATSGFKIPPPPAKKKPAVETVVLDRSRIERIWADTDRVSALLSEIFVEEETPPPPKKTTDPAKGNDGLDGLDQRHQSLLRKLLTQSQWERSAFAALCRSFELLPDGALETLNEWSFDRFDEPIINDEETITLNAPLLVSSASSGPKP